MAKLAKLAACAGQWRGISKLQDPHNNLADESPSTATVTPIANGKFVRLDYTWAYRGSPQEGSLLVGCDSKAGKFTAHWIDSWHMSDKVMACEGPAQSDDAISVRGSYAAPPGPDWGWRIDLMAGVYFRSTGDGQSLRMAGPTARKSWRWRRPTCAHRQLAGTAKN